MRPITQQEGEQMREALKKIAEFRNDALDPQEPGQAAALKARETLERLDLFFQKDVNGPHDTTP